MKRREFGKALSESHLSQPTKTSEDEKKRRNSAPEKKELLLKKQNIYYADALIIGAGAGGCEVAIELAERLKQKSYAKSEKTIPDSVTNFNREENQGDLPAPKKIILLDAKKVLSGTSDVTPGRAGLGFHYVDFQTGLMYMRATINLARRHPGYMVGDCDNLPASHPIKRGRYFITKDSLFPKEQILNVWKQLQDAYRMLVREDPENEIFGPPDEFLRILKPEEYANDVNMEKIDIGIETPEQLLDWPRYRAFRLSKLYGSDVTIFEDTPIINITRSDDGERYIATAKNGTEFHARLIVNATWENVEYLNEKLGFIKPKSYRTNRLKGLVKAQVPDEVKDKNSMFFCMGPHCMSSNMGDGTWLISYAPKTNIEDSTATEPTATMKRYLAGKMTLEEKLELGREILEGAQQYIPGLAKAKLLDVRTGIVKTIGGVDIFAHNSAMHKRDYSGITEEEIGFISNSLMKLLYMLENAREVVDLIEAHFAAKDKIKSELQENHSQLSKDKMIKFLFLMNIKKISAKAITKEGAIKTIFRTMDVKTIYHENLKSQLNKIKDEVLHPSDIDKEIKGKFSFK